ncbi:heavy-metal-associated domain-containing protein [Sphingomonas xanthus]|uniref:Heavy-metal-associated domain-containing protein n=1 Tax=Sphingomonas xanthus TaxID=2594473 RepID=A0A516ITN0_9SPHN|nr:heavy-metal-associated domain-containing protein [Sphingomonas xanthus]QDP20268.1 heavy-metal-associated domain-containing protein [Sphingomonas xanthus]
MLVRWPAVIITAALLAAIGLAGGVIAQMEAGERGILPIDSSGTLEITGISVDVGGKDAESARFAGWRVAQREGFKALWAKTNSRPVSEAPNLSDSTLDGLVSSIVVDREQIGPTRYIATLGVLFDRARAGELLGVPGQVRRSAPMLLVPVMVAGGGATSVELRNPWQRAWAQFRTSQSPVDYVRVSGMGVDPLLINAAMTRRPGRSWWRNVLDFYGAANVLVAEVRVQRLYPGGPSKATFLGYFGPDRQPLGSFEMVAKDSSDLPRMMSEGVQRMDRLFTDALEAGIVRGDPDLIIQQPPPPPEEPEEMPPPRAPILIAISSPNDAWRDYGLAVIRSIRGVSISGSGSTVSVTYSGTPAELRDQLIARGLTASVEGGAIRLISAPKSAAPDPGPAPAPSQPLQSP